MRAMQITGDWGLENLKPARLPTPEPLSDEALVAIKAISINPRDLVMANGGYGRQGGTLPLIPLCDGAGEVVAVGNSVTDIKVGDRVAPSYSSTWLSGIRGPESVKGAHGGPADGTAREFMPVLADSLVKLPDSLTYDEGATLPCAAVTAWNALVEQGQINSSDTVLLQGTGAVSLFALQIALIKGATVIMTSSSEEKLNRVRGLGAHHVINYNDITAWDKTVKEITDGRGVDLVVEVGGAETLERSLKSVRTGGTLSMIGVLAGRKAEFDLGRVVTRNIRLQGVTVGSKKMFDNMVAAFASHNVHPVLDDATFELEELAVTLGRLPENKHFGKIIGTL